MTPRLSDEDKNWLLDTLQAAIRENYMPAIESQIERVLTDRVWPELEHIVKERARVVAHDVVSERLGNLIGRRFDVYIQERAGDDTDSEA